MACDGNGRPVGRLFMIQYYTNMKFLLTGKPGAGKTKLLQGFIEQIPNKQGFLAEEVLENGKRTGFRLVSSDGKTAMFASVDSSSPMRVSKYGVDVETLDQFLYDLPPFDPKNMVYIDEIGPMQLYSADFKRLVAQSLDTATLYVGTLKYSFDNEFITAVRARDDAAVLYVTPENRIELRHTLDGIARGAKSFIAMDETMRHKVTRLACQYVKDRSYIQLRKLFNNAANYVMAGSVHITDEGYTVSGNHSDHNVVVRDGQYICDCDLFNGRGDFAGQPGECSHIQAVTIIC